MSIIRTKKDKNYSCINNTCLRDKRLSAKAKGIHAYIMSLPDDWIIYTEELESHFSDGYTSIKSGMKELIKFGYIQRERPKNEKGQYTAYDYTIVEIPQDYPVVITHAGSPTLGNLALLSTDLTKDLKTKKNFSQVVH
jgi:hypothetical protein